MRTVPRDDKPHIRMNRARHGVLPLSRQPWLLLGTVGTRRYMIYGASPRDVWEQFVACREFDVRG